MGFVGDTAERVLRQHHAVPRVNGIHHGGKDTHIGFRPRYHETTGHPPREYLSESGLLKWRVVPFIYYRGWRSQGGEWGN